MNQRLPSSSTDRTWQDYQAAVIASFGRPESAQQVRTLKSAMRDMMSLLIARYGIDEFEKLVESFDREIQSYEVQ
jgi:hypothetical protein